jgi:hypothetical protein
VLRALLLAILLLACAPVQAQQADGLRLVDLTGPIDAFWSRTQNMDGAARAAAFRAEIGPLIPGFYEPRGARRDPARYDQRIATALAGYGAQRDAILTVSRRFATMFAPARRSFETVFGPVNSPQPVYLLFSMGEMDGGTRDLPGGTTLIFGTDMIARYHMDHDIQPFFHHELFHVYHQARFTDCGAVWCSLWIEGLATYVAKSLNPGASDAELLLTMPEPIPTAVDAHRQEAVCAVLARLDSTADTDMSALFSFDRMNARLPPRFGYYVGYRVAETIGRGRTLPALAAMQPAEVRPLIERTLRGFATCPA